MFKRIAVSAVLVCLGTIVPIAGADESNLPTKSDAVAGLLKQTIDTKGLQEPIKLKIALQYFSDKFAGKLPILLDKAAFTAEDPSDPYDDDVSLPPGVDKMPMRTALQMILSQVGKGQATYLIRKGQIEIVPKSHATASRFLAQPILTSFDNRPLFNVLIELSDESGLTINIDPGVGKKANSLITASFRNCSLEDSLVAVTEMADLKFVVLQNSIYVTTAKRAELMEKEEKARSKNREPAPKAKANGNKRMEAAS